MRNSIYSRSLIIFSHNQLTHSLTHLLITLLIVLLNSKLSKKIDKNLFELFPRVCLDVRQAFRSMTKNYFKLFQVFQSMRVHPELELSVQVELPLASDL